MDYEQSVSEFIKNSLVRKGYDGAIPPEKSFAEIDSDGLKLIEITMEVEDEFDIDLGEYDFDSNITFRDFVKYAAEKLKERMF